MICHEPRVHWQRSRSRGCEGRPVSCRGWFLPHWVCLRLRKAFFIQQNHFEGPIQWLCLLLCFWRAYHLVQSYIFQVILGFQRSEAFEFQPPRPERMVHVVDRGGEELLGFTFVLWFWMVLDGFGLYSLKKTKYILKSFEHIVFSVLLFWILGFCLGMLWGSVSDGGIVCFFGGCWIKR